MCLYSLQTVITKLVPRISPFHICHGNVQISRLFEQCEFLVLTACRTPRVRQGCLHFHLWANSIPIEETGRRVRD